MNNVDELRNYLHTHYDFQYDPADNISISTDINGKQCNILIRWEQGNFEINIGKLVTLNKIEEYDLTIKDVINIVTPFLDLLTERKLNIYQYKFLSKTYSLNATVNLDKLQIIEYQSITGTINRLLGKKRLVGVISASAG